MRLLTYPKQSQLNDQVSKQMAAFLERLYFTGRLLSCDASGYCNRTLVAVHTYPNPSSVLIHKTISFDYVAPVTFNMPFFLAVIGGCGELLYSEE